MATEAQTRMHPSPSAAVWPPDDTEESILGLDLHQTTISNFRLGINEAARARVAPGEPVPWQALTQLLLLGCMRPDGSPYRTYPDLFVYPRPIDTLRGSFTLRADGPPALIVEVLSESTYEADLDLAAGKGYSYARAGVREYLAIDPTGAYLLEGIRAWRLDEGIYRPWEPDAQGRWQSAEVGVAIGLEGTQASVYTPEGQRMLREGEIQYELARRDEELVRRDQEFARELARRDEELERLRRLLDARQES